ncbi:AAA family ATPase [uncultured Thiodictyon sp.]|uniref:AAA family ATPase n=1 Tax=uncultured Thiodictyon sp. TaxID=1846217 RepID=UPI0025ED7610|nr:AAA family ATPase [uncultured Thiodictyon sp.]
MAERDPLDELPGTWALGWWMLMRPVSLHRRLLGLRIDPAARPWRLLGSRVERVYLARMAVLLFLGTPVLAALTSVLLAAPGFEIDMGRVASGVAFGVARSVALSVAGGLAFGVALGVAGSMAFGVALGVAGGVAFGVPVGVGVGVVSGVVSGLARGVAVGVAGSAGYLRLPIYAIELPWQLLAFAIQRTTGRITLAQSPVLHHELSYVPLPTLTRHILDTAPRDQALARRALDACAIAPGQRRAGRRALALLRARELEDLAERHAFQSLRDLRGDWLPDLASADGTFSALAEVGRYLRSAELTLIASQRLEQLGAAAERLRGLDNALLGRRDLESPIYRAALAPWRRLVERLTREAQAEADRELPNPFRPGDPLDLEFGREVFRGREPQVAEIESILGDPARGASMALIGARRCGKTSLLKMLPLKLPDAQVVFFDVQAHPVDSPATLVAALVRVAQEQARRDRRLVLPELPAGAPLEALAGWLERLDGLTAIGRILFCFDEFERWEALFPGDRRALLQFLGLIRATIQHRRRVRILVSGAARFDELDGLWSDHFVNLRTITIGHLDQAAALGLLTRPSPGFPADALPQSVAQAVWGRTLGQPYLTQLFGQLIVERLNDAGRRQAEVADCAAVEPQVLDRAASAYLSQLVQAAPAPALRVLETLARGESVDFEALDRPTRRYLRRRGLVTEAGGLGIPVLGAFLMREL